MADTQTNKEEIVKYSFKCNKKEKEYLLVLRDFNSNNLSIHCLIKRKNLTPAEFN